MNNPIIKVIAVSNIYSRLMHFVNKGDVEIGHSHSYDHATMVSAGSVLYEVLDGHNGNVVRSKEFTAPDFVFVEKEQYHRITSLEDNTVCVCIHALRTIDEDLVPPDFLIEPVVRKKFGEISNLVYEKTGKPWSSLHTDALNNPKFGTQFIDDNGNTYQLIPNSTESKTIVLSTPSNFNEVDR